MEGKAAHSFRVIHKHVDRNSDLQNNIVVSVGIHKGQGSRSDMIFLVKLLSTRDFSLSEAELKG
jgi:hypothetical protein